MGNDRLDGNLFSCYADDGANFGAAEARGAIRGARWVMRWFIALAVLFVASSVLLEFAYCLVAEHTVMRAARAGALEATLPRATTYTISETVARRLADYSSGAEQMSLAIHRNNRPAAGRWIARPGDRISVSVTLPSTAVLPRWLARVKFWHGSPPIEASAERDVPGRMIGRRQ